MANSLLSQYLYATHTTAATRYRYPPPAVSPLSPPRPLSFWNKDIELFNKLRDELLS